MLKPPPEKLMEKFNKPMNTILRNQQELFAKEDHLLLKMEENLGMAFMDFLQRDPWLVLSDIKLNKTLVVANYNEIELNKYGTHTMSFFF